MAEFSGLWTTTGGAPTGDQQVSYTQAQDAALKKVMAGLLTWEGVHPTYLLAYAGTVTGANTVAINTGAALVDGKYHYNSASLNVNIPSSAGGSTRIDRIVLRCSWAGFTVRITRIAGVDSGAPTVPAITQTPGTTYDILLYQALVNSTGTVTLTDERTMAQVPTAGIKDANVTLAKMAANSVDSSKIVDGSIVVGDLADNAVETNKIKDSNVTTPKLAANAVETLKIKDDAVTQGKLALDASKVMWRQGGSATNWGTVGAGSNWSPLSAMIQVGAISVPGSSYVNVTFPVAFHDQPIAVITPNDLTSSTISLSNLSKTGFRLDNAYGFAKDVYWIAIGPAA